MCKDSNYFSHFCDLSVYHRCGYTVSKVANGSVKLVHETSVKHYKDDVTFTLTDKEVWKILRLHCARAVFGCEDLVA